MRCPVGLHIFNPDLAARMATLVGEHYSLDRTRQQPSRDRREEAIHLFREGIDEIRSNLLNAEPVAEPADEPADEPPADSPAALPVAQPAPQPTKRKNNHLGARQNGTTYLEAASKLFWRWKKDGHRPTVNERVYLRDVCGVRLTNAFDGVDGR
ncbi:hypothetical protein GL218_07439 [Daldinia childiae]|uniref:uncharacterized protein n=1 Tax=Daldinia childiae TaxID=326645 RepID=UPI0014469ACE|nr:uncharacterized protein GL218_07439 [Daldinia childiae]KAF3054799.1 hypothetical protein GL218_07439 [Daldinia childiae]